MNTVASATPLRVVPINSQHIGFEIARFLLECSDYEDYVQKFKARAYSFAKNDVGYSWRHITFIQSQELFDQAYATAVKFGPQVDGKNIDIYLYDRVRDTVLAGA